MEEVEILNHADLVSRIIQLKADKLQQEEELKKMLKEFTGNLSPASILKETLHELFENTEAQNDITKAGIDIGANVLTSWIGSKQSSIKGLISAVIIGMISRKVISNNSSKIVSGVGKLLQWGYEKVHNKQ
ncbi:MAG TPA: hypothetical protein VK783_03460 [Bacteroidia bacterium]|jgi:hypothetical protein|nr:hypothetical protein [Bacteroidia bacterium]